MAYNKNSLPTKVRAEIQKEFPEAQLVAKQNYRMDITHPVSSTSASTTQEQLTTFRSAVMDILNGMDERFALVNSDVQVDETINASVLFVRVRAVNYQAPDSSSGKHKGSTDINETIYNWINDTVTKANEYFSLDVSDAVATLLHEANDKRKEEATAKALNDTLVNQFGNERGARLAALLKKVLEEEAEKGISGDDSAVIVDLPTNTNNTNDTTTDDEPKIDAGRKRKR